MSESQFEPGRVKFDQHLGPCVGDWYEMKDVGRRRFDRDLGESLQLTRRHPQADGRQAGAQEKQQQLDAQGNPITPSFIVNVGPYPEPMAAPEAAASAKDTCH